MAAISGHEVSFSNCSEIGQGGPKACDMRIDGRPVPGHRFDPSPLGYRHGILVPVRKSGFLNFGYALAFVDPVDLTVRAISKVRDYMRLIEVRDDEVVFMTCTYGDERDSLPVRID